MSPFTQTLSACYRGYGCGIVEIRMAPGTIYSDKAMVGRILPGSAEDMRNRQRDYVESNFPLRQSFQTENVPFVIEKCDKGAYCAAADVKTSEHTGGIDVSIVKVMAMGGSVDSLDIPADVAMRACNTTTVDSANRMLDIALAAGAVCFVCYINDYRGRTEGFSRVTGSPIILWSKLLACVDVHKLCQGTEVVEFDPGFSIGEPSSPDHVTIRISPVPVTGIQGLPPPSPDFPLVGSGIMVDKALAVSFNVKGGGTILECFFSLSRPCINPKGSGANAIANAEAAVKFSRKRWGQDVLSSVDTPQTVTLPFLILHPLLPR